MLHGEFHSTLHLQLEQVDLEILGADRHLLDQVALAAGHDEPKALGHVHRQPVESHSLDRVDLVYQNQDALMRNELVYILAQRHKEKAQRIVLERNRIKLGRIRRRDLLLMLRLVYLHVAHTEDFSQLVHEEVEQVSRGRIAVRRTHEDRHHLRPVP